MTVRVDSITFSDSNFRFDIIDGEVYAVIDWPESDQEFSTKIQDPEDLAAAVSVIFAVLGA